MEPTLHTTHPPPRPLVIYDGQCEFCRYWIAQGQKLTRDELDYAPFQESADRFSDVPREAFERSVRLIEPDGAVYGGALAVFRALARLPAWRWPFWLYRHVPGVALLSEWAYRLVARHRTALGRFHCSR